MARKRTIEEVDNITDLEKPMLNTSLHGAITSLSPIKKGRKSLFFDGMLADDTSKVQVVGYEAHQQKRLNKLYQNNVPIQLVDSEVKKAQHGQGYEVLLKSSTQIKESPKKLDVSSLKDDATDISKPISLEELQAIDNYEKITVLVKAMSTNPPDTVNDIPHQDVFVADHTGTVRVSLWGDSINSIQQNTSYQLSNFTVREYHSKKYLNMSKQDSLIEIAPDIGTVIEATPEEEETTIDSVQIVGVPLLDMYKACLQCKARVEPMTPPLGKCTKANCDMVQCYDLCTDQITAKLLILYKPDEKQTKYIQCHIFGQLVHQLLRLSPEGTITARALLPLSNP